MRTSRDRVSGSGNGPWIIDKPQTLCASSFPAPATSMKSHVAMHGPWRQCRPPPPSSDNGNTTLRERAPPLAESWQIGICARQSLFKSSSADARSSCSTKRTNISTKANLSFRELIPPWEEPNARGTENKKREVWNTGRKKHWFFVCFFVTHFKAIC